MESLRPNSSLHEEMLFETKNKAYGAYFIRKCYDSHLRNAFFIVISFTFFAFTTPFLFNEDAINSEPATLKEDEGTLVVLPPPPIEIEKIIETKPEIPSTPTEKFVTPVVTSNEIIAEKMATQEVLSTSNIGTETIKTDNPTNTTLTINIDKTETAAKAPEITSVAQVMPEFPGGEAALFKYLKKHLKYPKIALAEHIEGTVFLSFIVNTNGEISDIKLLRGIAGGCVEEAFRVISSMPAWRPGMNNGKAVPVLYNLPIKYTIK